MDKDKLSIKDVIKLHRSVSENIKTYETLTDEYMPIEVSNELRYAFRGLIDYLDDKKSKEDYDLVRVHYALRCAYFDLIDGLIITVYEYSNELLRDYPRETMQVISTIVKINEYVHSLNEKVSKSRGGSQDDKILIYKDLHKDEFKLLSDHYKTLKFSEPLIKEMFIKKKKKERNSYIVATISMLIGVVGIVVSMIN